MAFTTEEEAALRGIIAIFKGQAPSLSDDVAEKATGLFPQWDRAGKTYTTGERIAYNGDLYVCLQHHVSQQDWTPAGATSLWAKNLDAVDGGVPAWAQPDSTNGYHKGAVVTYGGKTWRSEVDNNVWEPGAAGSETLWQEVTA